MIPMISRLHSYIHRDRLDIRNIKANVLGVIRQHETDIMEPETWPDRSDKMCCHVVYKLSGLTISSSRVEDFHPTGR